MGKPKSVKVAEWHILNYLLTGEGANMSIDGLNDLAEELYVFKDKVAEKRFKTACKNIETVLSNMLSKRPEPEE